MPVNGTENKDAGKNRPTGRGFTRQEFLAGGAGLLLLAGCGGTGDPVVIGQMIASIPVLIIFVIAQRYVIEGIARSGIKG